MLDELSSNLAPGLRVPGPKDEVEIGVVQPVLGDEPDHKAWGCENIIPADKRAGNENACGCVGRVLIQKGVPDVRARILAPGDGRQFVGLERLAIQEVTKKACPPTLGLLGVIPGLLGGSAPERRGAKGLDAVIRSRVGASRRVLEGGSGHLGCGGRVAKHVEARAMAPAGHEVEQVVGRVGRVGHQKGLEVLVPERAIPGVEGLVPFPPEVPAKVGRKRGRPLTEKGSD